MQNYTDGFTKVCGIIGNPVRHTMSPLIHNSLAEMTGENLVYVPFEVKENGVESAVKGAYELGICGLNVTVPYKSEVLPFLVDIDPLAQQIGAVNTLVRDDKKGGYKGYNTDMTGLFHALCDEGIEFEGRTVVILGAGGVARPTAYLCASKGAKKVFILNRSLDKAEKIAEEVGKDKAEAFSLSDYADVCEKAGEKFIAIQCTSVGLYPKSDDVVISDESFYEHIDTAVDLIYRPLKTKFLEMAEKAGAKTVSGLKMLLYQGIDAYELWNAEDDIKIAPQEASEIYRSLEMEVIGARNIILEGFMGCGKTTISELLSDNMELELIDTDEAIEQSEGLSVSMIFEQMGENAFRDMETDLLRFFDEDHMRNTVISLGGGMPVREENRALIKKLGKVVYLKVSPETVYNRLKNDDTRPLLRSSDPIGRIKELLMGREKIYEEAADIIIETDDLTPSEVADKIRKEIFSF